MKPLIYALSIASLAASTVAHAPAMAEPIVGHFKCGPFNIRIEPIDLNIELGDISVGEVNFDVTKGKEDRSDQYDFIRVKTYTTNTGKKAAFWAGVLVKDRRRSMTGTLETDLTTGRTTYTEERFIGARMRSLGKVVKVCSKSGAATSPRTLTYRPSRR